MSKNKFKISLNRSSCQRSEYDFKSSYDDSGLDLVAKTFYFYPIDYELRNYQLEAVRQALNENVMLCLPTGLGKTFVAAVIMMNFYRWYPNKKVIFIAPTRPLVSQQHSACITIGGIRIDDTTFVTGCITSNRRAQIYEKYRIFFMTPQILQNDISYGYINPQDIICLVIDEAHRASGNYSYCQVIRSIESVHEKFRILALTASPGENINVIQSVVDNLRINKIVFYHEDHPDLKPFVKEKQLTEIVLEFTGPVKELLENFGKVIINLLTHLSDNGVLSSTKLGSWSSYRLMMTIDSFKEKKDRFTQEQHRALSTQLHVTHFLLNAYERLYVHGVLAFTRSIFSSSSNNFSKSVALHHLQTDPQLYENIAKIHNDIENCLKESKKPEFPYHPKITFLADILIEHLTDVHYPNSRVIVFTHYRDSVDEIIASLTYYHTSIKAMPFVGQAVSKNSKGLKQKEQLEALSKFRNGDFNVLVSTSVGEEGLDIGEVNLIVFFDVSSSPLRLIQRMGRTGRRKSGKIVILLMKGSEQSTYHRAKNKSRMMNSTLINKVSSISFRQNVPLINDHEPICILSKLSCASTIQEPIKSKSSIGGCPTKRYVPKHSFDLTFHMPPYDITSYHILGIPEIFHSVKSKAKMRLLQRLPEIDVIKSTSKNMAVIDNLVPKENATVVKPQYLSNRVFESDSDFEEVCYYMRSQSNQNTLENRISDIVPANLVSPIKGSSNIQIEIPSSSTKTSQNVITENISQDVILVSQESVIYMKPKKRSKLESTSSIKSSDSDSTFLKSSKIKKNQKDCKKSLGRQMLLTQANVVDGGSSDTELPTEDDYVQDSFINDESLNASKVCPEKIYKQSLLEKVPKPLLEKKITHWDDIVERIENKIHNNEYTDDDILHESSEIFSSCSKTFSSSDTISNSPNKNSTVHSTESDSIIKIGSPVLNNNLCNSDFINLDVFVEPLDIPVQHKLDDIYEMFKEYTILVDSKAFANSQIPSLLRNKYHANLINFPNMAFDFILGRKIAADIMKSKEILKDGTAKNLKKYSMYQHLYDNIYVIFQLEPSDEIDLSQPRLKIVYSLLRSISLEQITVLFSYSQDHSAEILSNVSRACTNEEHLPPLQVDSLKLGSLIKVASMLTNLQVISPGTALELLVNSNTLKNLIIEKSYDTFIEWSKDMTTHQAQVLHKLFDQFIHSNSS